MAFRLLPLEVNSNIAGFLDEDVDLCNFSLVCRETHAAVSNDRSPLWRVQFEKHFDLPRKVGYDSLKRVYQYRRKRLRQGARFWHGTTRDEKECLRLLRELILESFRGMNLSRDKNGRVVSKNLQSIKKFAMQHNIVRDVLIPPVDRHSQEDRFLRTIQNMLIHIQLDLELPRPMVFYDFPGSQQTMYVRPNAEIVFEGRHKTEINMLWVTHAINFFRYYFTTTFEQVYPDYVKLEMGKTIQPWRGPIRRGVRPLGRRWIGSYAYLDDDDMYKLRHTPGTIPLEITDNFNNTENPDNPFQTLMMNFFEEDTPTFWPDRFERHLCSKNHPSLKQQAEAEPRISANMDGASSLEAPASAASSKPSSKSCCGPLKDERAKKKLALHFRGPGMDAERYHAAGWITSLPSQHGIPGWMRFTMMKFILDRNNNPAGNEPLTEENFNPDAVTELNENILKDLEEDSMWAYEGVVLPGGEVIVGRWWSPDEDRNAAGELLENDGDVYSGPFLYWCVDEKGAGKG